MPRTACCKQLRLIYPIRSLFSALAVAQTSDSALSNDSNKDFKESFECSKCLFE